MESGLEKVPNSLKSEHLKEGIKPIIACMGDDGGHDFLGKSYFRDKIYSWWNNTQCRL